MISEQAATAISKFLYEYAREKSIYMKVNHVNAEHVHAIIDLPTSHSIESVMHLLKGASSHWINERGLVNGKFTWGRGYAVFAVSESALPRLVRYIANQDEHHRHKSFLEEYRQFLDKHGLKWNETEDSGT